METHHHEQECIAKLFLLRDYQGQGDRAGISKYIIGVCIVLSGALAVTLETVFVSWVMIADTVGLRGP